jgi:hypothetical protein
VSPTPYPLINASLLTYHFVAYPRFRVSVYTRLCFLLLYCGIPTSNGAPQIGPRIRKIRITCNMLCARRCSLSQYELGVPVKPVLVHSNLHSSFQIQLARHSPLQDEHSARSPISSKTQWSVSYSLFYLELILLCLDTKLRVQTASHPFQLGPDKTLGLLPDNFGRKHFGAFIIVRSA